MKEEEVGRRRGSGADGRTGGGARERVLKGGRGSGGDKRTGGWTKEQGVVER